MFNGTVIDKAVSAEIPGYPVDGYPAVPVLSCFMWLHCRMETAVTIVTVRMESRKDFLGRLVQDQDGSSMHGSTDHFLQKKECEDFKIMCRPSQLHPSLPPASQA